jgi:hypothetical protein
MATHPKAARPTSPFVLPVALVALSLAVATPFVLPRLAPRQSPAQIPAQVPAPAPAPPVAPAASTYSFLWGERGEKWSASGRLPDFSFAGYRSGDVPIPNVPVKSNVRDFGAKGDGTADDTAAFKRAIAETDGGAILIPAGRYKITDILYIRKSNIVLRGAGSGKSVLFFPTPLESLKPNMGATTTGQATSNYSWSGGLVWVEGKNAGADVGAVAERAVRGAHEIKLEENAKLSPQVLAAFVGRRVEISQQDPGDNSLIDHVYAGQSGDVSKIKGVRVTFVSRVAAVDGTKLLLERPLQTSVAPMWKPRVRVFAPGVSEVGIEDLGFEFASGPYGGHFSEPGFNVLALSGVSDCWARRLRVFNADSGPFLSGHFNTIEDIVFEADRAPDKAGNTGHHGVTLGSDNLLKNFDFKTRFVHDISAERSAGSVASDGRGVDLCFDHHKRFPHANLFTNIDIGEGKRMYRSGGGAALGRHAGAWTTFWNIRAARPQKWPAESYGPDMMNLVAVQSDDAPILDENGRWFEPIAPAQIEPKNLYEAQLARRLKSRR